MLLTPISWQAPTTLPAAGKATYYAEGVMESVWRYRLWVGDVAPCGDCLGGVATMHPADIGKTVWIQHGDDVIGPFMVVDCAAAQDYPSLVQRGLVLEVPYWVARRWKMAGPVDVEVLDRPSRDHLE